MSITAASISIHVSLHAYPDPCIRRLRLIYDVDVEFDEADLV